MATREGERRGGDRGARGGRGTQSTIYHPNIFLRLRQRRQRR